MGAAQDAITGHGVRTPSDVLGLTFAQVAKCYGSRLPSIPFDLVPEKREHGRNRDARMAPTRWAARSMLQIAHRRRLPIDFADALKRDAFEYSGGVAGAISVY